MNFYSKSIFLLGLSIFCIFLLSCNKEISCNEATSTLNFISFPNIETDTIILKRFTKATNFTTPVDTFSIHNSNSSYERFNDTLQIGNSFGGDNGLKSKYDYEIFLPHSNRIFRISEITEEFTHITGGGLFSMDKRSCVNLIKSYKINGQLVNGDYNYYRFYIRL